VGECDAKLLRRSLTKIEVCYRGIFLNRLSESPRKDHLSFRYVVAGCCWVNIMLGEGPRSSIMAIIAALNEEEGIGPTIAELRQYLENPRILVIDGNSRDRTVEIAKDLCADIVFQIGSGKGDAIAQALKCVRSNFDFAILTDADYTYPAGFLPRMIQILEDNPKIGMVCGNRFNSHFNLSAMHDLFYFGNRLLAFTHNLMNGVALRDPLTGLRAIRWELLKDWEPRSKGFDIEVELNHHIERQGYEIKEIDIPYRTRLGEKKLKMRHGATIIKRIILETIY
jgi:glycosyltransferase involved in cell wall biosynthesis